MTAAGHVSSTIRDDLHGVSAPILLAKYPQLAYTSRLRIPPNNTPCRKAGLGYTLEGRTAARSEHGLDRSFLRILYDQQRRPKRPSSILLTL
jgi:hypothetical protein